MQQAQIRVLVSDASDSSSVREASRMLAEALNPTTAFDATASTQEDNGSSQATAAAKLFFIRNKIDNLGGAATTTSMNNAPGGTSVQQFDVSCATGDGIPSLESALTQAALSLLQPSETVDGASDATESAVITRDRHRSHVKRCVRHLDEFIEAGLPMDAAAEELRYAPTSPFYMNLLIHEFIQSSMTLSTLESQILIHCCYMNRLGWR